MFQKTLQVKYITSKSCFCYFPDKYSKVIQQGSVIKTNFEDKTYFFSVGDYLINLKPNEVGIDRAYAGVLGLKEDEFITCVEYDGIPKASCLDISPNHRNDFEILELMAERIQDTLLNQIRIVNNNQKALIWISNSISVIVNIDGVKPATPARLEYLTEVAIKAPNPKNNIEKPNFSNNTRWNVSAWFKNISVQPITCQSILTQYNTDIPLVFRIFSLECLKKINNKDDIFNVYAPKKLLPPRFVQSQNKFFALQPIYLPTEWTEDTDKQKNIAVRISAVEDYHYDLEIQYVTPIFINDAILKYYNLTIGAKVVLDSDVVIGDPIHVQILSNAHNLEETKQRFKQMVAKNLVENKTLLNPHVPIPVGHDNSSIVLNIFPENYLAYTIDSDFIRQGKITVEKSESSGIKEAAVKKNANGDICLCMANLENILNGCINNLRLRINTHGQLEHVLVVGNSGAGKTTIVNHFAEIVSSKPYYIHVETINCKNIKGKSLDSLHKLFTNTFLKLIYYQPSLLIVDDIHVISENVVEEDTNAQETASSLSEMLVDLFEHYLQHNFIMLIATTESTLKLNQRLFMARGNHILKNIFNIAELSKTDRKAFLNFAFTKCGNIAKDIDVDLLSVKTEGFVAQDLVDFVDKCIFESYKEDSEEINEKHCLDAVNVSSSCLLKNVKLHSSGDRDFSDIGGFDEAKNILIETMMWPIQYTNIFGRSPLRLQSGLLLYGPPGTGKTILAGAAAKQCDLRLISIKGPELLSKYIGASEQAVRDIFRKAQAAKPCVLFFDEFDSLAPRRGHDITGVTDRVVNQFLTQLDGIENLTGVCVLAATSRPDLLDPALLRPGRLDQQILCSLPSKVERLSILKALSKNLCLSEGVNFESVAAATEGYSGADLQSILCTAQLTSMEHLLSETETELSNSVEPVIDQQQLAKALENTRPSLTREERLKYDRIYAKFQGKTDIDDIRRGKQKATLA